MAKLTLSTGSNLGNRRELLADALRALEELIGPAVFASDIVETPAWGVEEQPAFLNQLIILDTKRQVTGPGIAPELHRLLDITQNIETEAGRVRQLHWGPRTLDIDLIFLGDIRYEDARISLPHPWWRDRAFVRDLIPSDPKFGPRYFQ